ncbi:MAG: ANTAR domain-containing protein [Williamsia herbipolensis]|uniref:ANTAR domain-containing protein n=1 Tax=Williamsia serinedens TaxID=391736 RepID=UPI0019DA399F|nr:GAF and ANTAR domain-containing protein [Williamsia serinedens]MBE7159700.1 ANTAR domain-containing protein [Williamsia herbipolensis]
MADSAHPTSGVQPEVPPTAGAFRYVLADSRWELSASLTALLDGAGAPREDETSAPTTPVDSTAGPLDTADIRAAMERLAAAGRPSATRHRITDRANVPRHVVIVGDRVTTDDGAVVGVSGYVVDVTTVFDEALENLDAEVSDFVEHRSVIEQAKGMMMLAYGFGDRHAYDVLAWRSQHTNTKVRVLAAAVVRDVPSSVTLGDSDRAAFDNILLTAHEND